MEFKAIRHWLKGNWFFVALIVLLFVAAIVEHGLTNGLWMATSSCYVIALMWFCSVAIPAMVFRTRLSWHEWAILAFACGFAGLAFVLDFPALKGVTAIGLATGVALGLFFLFFAWRLRAK